MLQWFIGLFAKTSYDPRMDLTLKDMRLEMPAIRNPYKTELSEDQKAFRLSQKG